MAHKEELYFPDCFSDDLEWLDDFMEDEDDEDLESEDGYLEDEFFESRQRSDEEAAEILGSPSEGTYCDPENVCAICLDPLEKCVGDLKKLPCKHIYHYNCILESTKTKNCCPMCRGDYDYRERKLDYDYRERKLDYEEYFEFPFYTEYFRNSLTRMHHGFLWPEMEEADEVEQIWGSRWELKPVHIGYPPIPFHTEYSYSSLKFRFLRTEMKEAFARFEMEEAVALFDEAAQVSKFSREGFICNPKNVCAIWHMKRLPRKHIYHDKSTLGSTKIKTNCLMCHGNMTARRGREALHSNHVI